MKKAKLILTIVILCPSLMQSVPTSTSISPLKPIRRST